MARFEPVGTVRSDRTEMSVGHWANVESYIPAERKDDVRLPAWVDRMMDGYF